jgi:O-antigen/teichoic acid export membrane protein
MVKYSVPMIPATIFWWITSVSDRYMVTWISGEVENGLYSAAYKIPTMLSLVSNVFIEAWQYSAVSEKEGRESFFGRVFEYYQVVLFIACGFMVGASQIFIALLCADSYFEAWRFVPVLSISAAFSGLTAFFGSVYLLKKKSVLTLITSMSGAIINIALNLLLIPQLGAQGAAISTCISYAVVFVIRAVNTRKYVKFSLHSLRIALNMCLLSLQTFFLLSFDKYVILIQCAFVLAIILVNIKPLLAAVKYIFSAILRKGKNKEKFEKN